MTKTKTNGERKRTTTTKKNTSNSSYLVQEVTPQILSLGTKLFVIFKKWFYRFFLCSGMNIEFLCQLELTKNYLFPFGHKEIVDLFVCLFCSKMRANKCILIHLPNWFLMCLDSDKKIYPLCYKHVIAMGSRKTRGKFH